jgi:ankyrin repeat protein
MMKFLEARARKSKLGTTVVSFFFHARGDTLQKSVEGLYRSLLYDTLKALPDLQSVLDDTTIIPSTKQGCPDHDTLKELLRSAIQRLGQRSLTFFIDALDECNEDDARDMVEFFRLLAEESIELRICFSSRPYPCIETEPDFVLEPEAGHGEDLAKYVSKNLKASKRLREDLQQQILDTAKGVFLWVVLVVKILNDENRKGIPNPRQRLRKIPAELGDLFKEMLMRDQERPEELKLCILWVLFEKRPLNAVELRHAIWADGLENGRYEFDDDSLFEDADEESSRNFAISTSKGLVEADDHRTARPTLQFIHESVRDFLIKERGVQKIWPELGDDWEANSHKFLMTCCRAYLNHPMVKNVTQAARPLAAISGNDEGLCGDQNPEDDKSSSDKRAGSAEAGCIFLGYASQCVLYHANLACQSIDHEGFLAWFFTSCGFEVLNYGQKYRSRQYEPTAEPLYILADQGCGNIIRASEGQYPAVYNGRLRFRHPLFAAMANNHEDAVAALLGLPDIFFEGRKLTEGLGRIADVPQISGRTPLSWAAQGGRMSLIKILVRNGADPKEPDPGGRRPWERAAAAGKAEAVDLLACLTVIVQMQDDSLRHSMWEDMYRGDIRGAMCVLKHPDARVAHDAINEALESDWMQMMSRAGLLPAVQFLGATSASEQLASTLATAAHYGHLKLVELILDNGVAIDRPVSAYGTALAIASRFGHADIVQFLISRGANVSLENNGWTALTHSCLWGHKDIVQLLVKAGADVNQQLKTGTTALIEASSGWCEDIVRFLLAHGADPNVADAMNRTALGQAIGRCDDDMAQMLRQSLGK